MTLPEIYLIFPKALDQSLKHTTFTLNLFYVLSLKGKNSFLKNNCKYIQQTLKREFQACSSESWSAQLTSRRSILEILSPAQTPFPHSFKFKQRLPSLGQGSSCCLPARASGSSFDLHFFFSTQSCLTSPGRGRGIPYWPWSAHGFCSLHPQKTSQNCTQALTQSQLNPETAIRTYLNSFTYIIP